MPTLLLPRFQQDQMIRPSLENNFWVPFSVPLKYHITTRYVPLSSNQLNISSTISNRRVDLADFITVLTKS
uniref:Uncharacterized protein n=1 Tax=Arundo donax TaxID=35708 RepID=A0A0A9BEZ3_ARUDO